MIARKDQTGYVHIHLKTAKKCDGIPSSLPTSNDQVDGERKGPVLQGYQQKSRLPLHIKDQDHPLLAYK